MTALPTDAAARKNLPVVTGCLDYFSDALLGVAELLPQFTVTFRDGLDPLGCLARRGTNTASTVCLALWCLRTLQTEITGVLTPNTPPGGLLGLFDDYTDALLAVTSVSKAGNDQHNPGQPLHWSRGKSDDHADSLVRHLLQRGTIDEDGHRHTAKATWRAFALLQIEIEEREGLPPSRGSRKA